MKRLSLIFCVISHLCLYVAVPVCCVVEYYAWRKMGMYRYLVMKNNFWLKNVFTPDTVPYILAGSVIVMLIVLFSYCRPIKSYSFSYVFLLTIGGLYLFRSEYFFSLRAAPYFGMSLILADVFFVLSVILRRVKAKGV